MKHLNSNRIKISWMIKIKEFFSFLKRKINFRTRLLKQIRNSQKRSKQFLNLPKNKSFSIKLEADTLISELVHNQLITTIFQTMSGLTVHASKIINLLYFKGIITNQQKLLIKPSELIVLTIHLSASHLINPAILFVHKDHSAILTKI